MRRFALLLLLAGCEKSLTAVPAPSPSATPAAAGSGVIAGVVRVRGAEIAPVTAVPVGAEHHCGGGPLDLGTWRVDPVTRGLADAYLFVEGWTAPVAPGPMAAIDNRRCVFVPPVVLMAPGDLKLTNSDTLAHSADLRSKLNPAENVLLAAGSSRILSLRIPEIVPVGCSVHPWMAATVIVARSPSDALSGQDGRFEMKGVPAGRRRLRLWHRCTGEVDAGEVTVEAGGRVEVVVEVEPRPGFRSGK